MDTTGEFNWTIRVRSPVRRLPPGRIALPDATARATSSGDIRISRSRSGSTRMTTVRWLAPDGGGADTPGMVANAGRTRLRARSWISPTLRVSLENTSCPTGTVPASKRTTNGATVPGGLNARARSTYDTTCASAWLMSVPGWKYIFTSDTPCTDFDSTWSTPAI